MSSTLKLFGYMNDRFIGCGGPRAPMNRNKRRGEGGGTIIGVLLPSSTVYKLKRIARQKGVSLSEVMREAIQLYIEREKTKRQAGGMRREPCRRESRRPRESSQLPSSLSPPEGAGPNTGRAPRRGRAKKATISMYGSNPNLAPFREEAEFHEHPNGSSGVEA